MAVRKTAEEVNLNSYFEGRLDPLAKRLLDVAEELLGKRSLQQQWEFEDRIEKQLQNGAKFVPRKRQPR